VSEFHFQSLVDTVDALRSGHLPAVTLARQMLRRIQSAESLAAYVSVDSEGVLARAAALDAQRARGEPLGRLHGIPLALKDLVDQAGKVTGAGGTVHGAQGALRNATVVDRLLAEGALILGKLRLTEGAYSQHHPSLPTPRNPWAPEHWTGVSSSGSGVATAAGLCFGALGTDTGGSIRFPSAACGVVGVKPSFGRVSTAGVFPLAPSLDHLGPMARSVRDAARLLTVMAGPDPADVRSRAYPEEDFEAALATGVAGLRVAFPKELWRAGVASALTEAGAAGGGPAPPTAAALIDGWALTAGVEAALVHEKTFPAQRGAYGPVLSTLLDQGHRASAQAYARLEQARLAYGRALDSYFEEVDALLVPAMPFLPLSLDSMDALAFDGYVDPLTFTAPFNYSGHPSVTLPFGFSAEGLPRAVQLVGRRGEESTLLRLAAACEARAPDRDRRPSIP
jgi:amidase